MDIRIDTKFFNHPKTMKLYRKMGAEGVLSLIRLWLWTAENRPTGQLLGLDSDDVDLIAAGGQTRSGSDQADQSFCTLAKGLGWIDTTPDGEMCLHEWAQYNPWAADAPNRSDKARFSKLASVAPAAYVRLVEEGRCSISAEEYRSIVSNIDATSKRKRSDVPAPAPSPTPTPIPNISRPEHGQGDDLLRAYRRFPGYRAELEVKEREWLELLRTKFQDLDILEELDKAQKWVSLKQDFNIRNSRAYIVRWLERVQKERRQ